jgi:hypothetical protein
VPLLSSIENTDSLVTQHRTSHSRPTHSPENAIHFTGVRQSFPSTSSLNNPKAQKAIIHSSFAFSMHCKVVIQNVTRAFPPKRAFLKQCHTMMHYDIRYDHWAMSGIPSSCVVGGTSMVICCLLASSRLGVGKGNGGIDFGFI